MSNASTPEQQEFLFAEFPPVSTEAWLDKIREDLGADFKDALTWESPDDLTMQAFYRAEDLPGKLRALPHPEGRPRDNRWRLRQDVSFASPDAVSHLHEALAGGVTDIGIHLSGVHRVTQDDFNTFIKNITLEETPLHLTGAPAEPLLALLLNAAEQRSVSAEALRGSVVHDPLGGWTRGEESTPEAALDAAADVVAYATERLPHLRVLTIDARVYRDAGTSAVQELATTLATMSEYLAGLTERGLDAEAILRQVQFIVPIGPSFFVQIGKLRALRLLFTQVASAYGQFRVPSSEFRVDEPQTPNSEPQTPYIQVETPLRRDTTKDEHENLLRATTEAAAAVFGGCDVLTVCPFDAADGEPSAFSRRLARNVSLLLQHEAHLDRVADPAGGSYYVEVLTHQLAHRAWTHFQDIEARGGLAESLRM